MSVGLPPNSAGANFDTDPIKLDDQYVGSTASTRGVPSRRYQHSPTSQSQRAASQRRGGGVDDDNDDDSDDNDDSDNDNENDTDADDDVDVDADDDSVSDTSRRKRRGRILVFGDAETTKLRELYGAAREQPDDTTLDAWHVAVTQINGNITRDQVKAKVQQFNKTQYDSYLNNGVAPTIRLTGQQFFSRKVERDTMLSVLLEHNMLKYDERLFAAHIDKWNTERRAVGLCDVGDRISTWCARERTRLRSQAVAEPFIMPTASAVLACFVQVAKAFVDAVGDATAAGAGEQQQQLGRHMALLRAIGDNDVSPIVELLLELVGEWRAAAVRTHAVVAEQQLYVQQRFHELLHATPPASLSVKLATVLRAGGAEQPSIVSVQHVLQLLWSALGAALQRRRVGHDGAAVYDVGATLGARQSDFGRYIRFDDDSMCSLYYMLGHAGSRVAAKWASHAQPNTFALAVLSCIYGNYNALVAYSFARKVRDLAWESSARGTLCFVPVDLFERALAVARAICSPTVASTADARKLIDTIRLPSFAAQWQSTLVEYRDACFDAELCKQSVFVDVYHKMMTQLFYHFALSCARERLTKLTKSILKQQAERKTETSKKLPTSAHLAVQTVAARTRRALKKENN